MSEDEYEIIPRRCDWISCLLAAEYLFEMFVLYTDFSNLILENENVRMVISGGNKLSRVF